MKIADTVKIFLLGMMTAFMGVLVFRGDSGQVAHAQGDGDQKGSIIAVTGPEDSSLYIIDTENKRLAFYTGKRSEGLRLRASRYYNYDYQMYDSNAWMTVKKAKSQAKKDKKIFNDE